MKKLFLTSLAISTLTLGLSACSPKPETPEEILDASIKAMKETNSFRIDMNIDQDLTYGPPSGEPDKQTAEIVTDYVKEPEGLHLNTHMNVAGPKVDAEMYFAEGEVYTTSSRWDHWYKGKENGYQPSLDTVRRMVDLDKRLEWLKTHSEEMEVKEEDDQWVLTFSGEGEKFNRFTEFILDLSKPALYQSLYLEDIKTNDLNYKIYIDRKSFLPAESEINIDIEMMNELDGNEMAAIQTIKETYTKMDEIEAVTIPSEVKDTAKDKF
ncbi:DUF6612 family protein [Rossellomorea aquimaris]|uniref:Lipoprotein n=1 Tax=Rossellomorea aquimaris TaxID=189382 RepID=A0A1J6X0Q9_9BACI|nr:DUF6612 family protein [Rossellomorea aquimaris]OIU71729.1 hypothetical protein BHE18_03455 [Rossellomorea aquimaris]